MKAPLKRIIAAASGRNKVDLLIRNARVVDLFSPGIEKKHVAISDGRIVGFGDYCARETVDLKGDFLCPGLIDGHVHIESSMLTVPQFSRAVLPHGTTTVISDPHEIANVWGSKGVRFMVESAKGVPLNVYIMVPSCVPATRMETSGGVLNARDIARLLRNSWAIGLGEMMNFPGVISSDREVVAKIEAAKGRRIDGHAPMLTGKELFAYLSAGIRSDHECTSIEEAREKLKSGMTIMIREGTAARNLEQIIPLVTPGNCRRFLFVTDDRHPDELLERGHIDSMVRKAITLGIDPLVAIQMATINTAEYFRLDDLGAIAPGYRADLISTGDLRSFRIDRVFKDGIPVVKDGKLILGSWDESESGRSSFRKYFQKGSSIRIGRISSSALILRTDSALANVIEIIPDQILTKRLVVEVPLRNGIVIPDLERDILKLAVVERHHGTGNVGVGLVKGFGLKKGAIGSSVAHDSHNLVIVATDDNELLAAIRSLKDMGGGLVVVSNRKALASLPLPVGGLMSDLPIEEVVRKLESLRRAARRIGCRLHDPFMTLSFLSLPVIPELKLTDRGLVDVNRFKFIPVFKKR